MTKMNNVQLLQLRNPQGLDLSMRLEHYLLGRHVDRLTVAIYYRIQL